MDAPTRLIDNMIIHRAARRRLCPLHRGLADVDERLGADGDLGNDRLSGRCVDVDAMFDEGSFPAWNAGSPLAGLTNMTRAMFDGVVVAQSDDVRVVEGMTYFPLDDVDQEHLLESPTTSRCFWKGKASYWHVQGRSDVAQNAAFTYQRPWPLARRLVTDRVAFWQGVEVVED